MIILLGMPKSGTSSFQELFTILGYNSYHWEKEGEYIGKMIENNKGGLLNSILSSTITSRRIFLVESLIDESKI